jgi:hypothetical protein
MWEITEIVDDFRALTHEDFLAKRPEPVLVHRTNPGYPAGEQGFFAGLDTQTDAATEPIESPLDAVDTARSLSGVLVLPVEPRDGWDGATRVTVGRNGSNDIRLPYRRVSRTHAYFVWNDDRTQWFVCDAGSTNGTWLFSERLRVEEPTVVPSGAELRFGTAEFSFHRAADFHDYLVRLMSRVGRR